MRLRLLVLYHLACAYDSLRANRSRTILTVLGIAIGIASIIVILSLSAGASRIISDQVNDLSGTVAVVRPGTATDQPQLNNLTSALAGSKTASNLTEEDLNDINQIDGVTAAAPLMIIGGTVAAGDTVPEESTIIATTPELPTVSEMAIREGQFIDSVTNVNTAVIGAQLAVDLFGTEQAAGRTFRTHDRTFTVIGILARTDNPINYNNVDFDHAAIISLDSGKQFNQNVASIQQINIRTNDSKNLPSVIKQVDVELAKNHFGERDFTILAGEDLAKPANELFYAIGATLTVVAGISLLVGGIGVMNIMLVGVAERTREIGIRKALGASNSHIVWQFLLESLVMSLVGGLLGYGLGYVVAFTAARTFLTFNPVFSWEIAAAAFGTALIVGLLFGLYPSIRAARKDPIASLRQYH